MRIMRILGMTCAVATLAGCSWANKQMHKHDTDYVRGAGTVHSMSEPPGAKAQRMGEYYPVPAGGSVDAKPPSLVPPGSNINQYSAKKKPKTVAKASAKKKTELVKLKSGDEALMLAANDKAAWNKVGAALKASGYQVLDQDSEMGAYFILDANQTENKITKQTPILRVNLKPKQQQTEVTLASHDNGKVAVATADRVLHQLQQHIG